MTRGHFMGGSVLTVIALAIAAWARPGLATDRGALTLEGGPSVRVGPVPPSMGSGEAVGGADVGMRLAVRDGLTDRLELHAQGFWSYPGTLVHRPTTISTPSGSASGALTEQVSRWGAGLGARYTAVGLVWRVPVGIEIGWAHASATNRDLLSLSAAAPTSLGLRLGDGSSNALSLAPFAGLEWLATDRLSFAILPRLELLLGSSATVGVVFPFTVGWSWYWF